MKLTTATIPAAMLRAEPACRKRLATSSYREERPATEGVDEDAWAQDRRGQLVPKD
jgi:hypothetical protein